MIPPSETHPEEPENHRSDDGSTKAGLEVLYAEMAGKLERIAWSILRDWPLAADAVQETFALLTSRYDEVPRDQQRGWLVKTVQFQAHNLRRKQQRSRDLSAQLFSSGTLRTEQAGFRSDKEQSTIEQTEERQVLMRAVAALPEAQRIVVLKRMNEEKGFAEIAAELAVPLGTVLSRMRLALEKLRNQLES